MKKYLFITIILLCFCLSSLCQTFVETQFSAPLGFGARAFGMGGAFIAIADDATAATWNPGGLGQIEHIEISAIGSYYDFNRYEAGVITPDVQRGTATRNGDSWSFDFIGISVPFRPFSESDFKFVLQYSYQSMVNFNLKSNTNPIHYINTFSDEMGQHFREMGYFYQNDEFSGGLDAHSFGIGLKLTSWLNIGATMNIWTNGYEGGTFYEFYSQLTNIDKEITVDHIYTRYETEKRNFSGTSFNFGALIQVTDSLNIGMMYRNKFTFDVTIPDRDVKYKIDYPYSLGFGIAYRPLDNLTIAGDFTYSNWSKGRIYNEQEEHFFPVINLPYKEPQENVEEAPHEFQHDTTQWRVGFEYVVISQDFLVPLRGGIYFDQQYFADKLELIPTYVGLTAGAGVVWKNFVLDVAIVFVTGNYQNDYWSMSGTDFSYFKGIASLIYRF